MKPAIALFIALTVVTVGAAAIKISNQARAEVAGMSHSDLRKDRDFRRAVESIVESCSISGSSISC